MLPVITIMPGPERRAGGGQLVGKPRQGVERVAHHVAAPALPDLAPVDGQPCRGLEPDPGGASRLRAAPSTIPAFQTLPATIAAALSLL